MCRSPGLTDTRSLLEIAQIDRTVQVAEGGGKAVK